MFRVYCFAWDFGDMIVCVMFAKASPSRLPTPQPSSKATLESLTCHKGLELRVYGLAFRGRSNNRERFPGLRPGHLGNPKP